MDNKENGKIINRVVVFKCITILVFAFFAWSSYAIDPVYKDFFGKAIKGTDPVAYFTEGKPTKGTSKYTYEWNGAEWHFSSEENLVLFQENPEKYSPQFGGYCAWAVSQGYTASIDPNAWKIVNEKLYLNYSLSVQKKWSRDIPGNIKKAEKNWPELLGED
jgi:YHS domain-containing protein